MEIKIPEAFKELSERGKYRFKIYHGGRGGGKTVNFGIALLILCMQSKLHILCVREAQKSIEKSVHKNLKDIILKNREKYGGIWYNWKITDRYIKFHNGSEFGFIGLKDMNASDLKSYSNVDICWVEEADAISNTSLKKLVPTIRNPDSELWFSFNRETENDPVYERYCIAEEKDILVKEVNYYDNPFFPPELDNERKRDLRAVEEDRMDRGEYEHIWLGKPKSFVNSSYYGKYIRKTEEQQRLCRGVYDEALKVHTVWDLGVSDATAIWFFQLYGAEIRLVDYYENSGEGIKFYLNVLDEKREENKYKYGDHFAPHDIRVREWGNDGKSRLETASKLGLDFNVLPASNVNEGIELVRINFHHCYFDTNKTTQGLKCLKNYRKLYDEKRQCYQEKPYHDWTSHGADGFRYLHQAVTFISPFSGGYKTDSEFDDDFERETNIHKTEYNKITGY